MRILLVDDDSAVRRALTRVLRRDADLAEAASAEEALAQLEGGLVVDLVLSDYHMDEMTGLDLYTRIEERFGASAPRVVLMSGSSMEPGLRRAVKEKGIVLLDKPFRIEELHHALERSAVGHG
jgi:CheY-like chemotaxis protein